jgi:hypothetical protein
MVLDDAHWRLRVARRHASRSAGSGGSVLRLGEVSVDLAAIEEMLEDAAKAASALR